MPKSKTDKKQILEYYQKKLKESESVFFVEPNGLTANEVIEFRKRLSAHEAKFNFIKNTLLVKAFGDNKEMKEIEEGKNIGLFIKVNTVEVAKMLKDFINEVKDKVKIKAGIFNGGKITKEQIIELASLPSREELLTKFVVVLNSPMSGFANVLAANIRGFENVLKSISEKK